MEGGNSRTKTLVAGGIIGRKERQKMIEEEERKSRCHFFIFFWQHLSS